jgi:hypothetical protein
MNKRILTLFTILGAISFAQNALAVTFHRHASVTIVERSSGIKPNASGGLTVSGGDNNVQIAYLSENKENGTNKVKYSTLGNNERINQSSRFSAQYE